MNEKIYGSLGYWIILLAIMGVFYGVIRLVPDTQLARSGIAVQGKIVDRRAGTCGGRHGTEPISVQFTDQTGLVDTSTFDQCDYQGLNATPGESITIVYHPDNPTVIAPRDELPSRYQGDVNLIVLIVIIELLLLGVWLVRLIGKRRRAYAA